MKVNLVSPSLQYGTAQIVMQNASRYAGPVFKSVDMTTQEVFQSLIEEKFQVQSTGVGQSDDETGEAPKGPAHTNFSEMSPIHLGFFRGEFMQLQKGFSSDGAQGGHYTAHLDHKPRALGFRLCFFPKRDRPKRGAPDVLVREPH